MFNFKYFYYFIIIIVAVAVAAAHILIRRDSFSPCRYLFAFASVSRLVPDTARIRLLLL